MVWKTLLLPLRKQPLHFNKRSALRIWIKQHIIIFITSLFLSSGVNTVQVSLKNVKMEAARDNDLIDPVYYSPPWMKLRWNFNYPPVCWGEVFLERKRAELQVKMFNQLLHSLWDKVVRGGRGGVGCVCLLQINVAFLWSWQWGFSVGRCYQAAMGFPSSNSLWSSVSSCTIGVFHACISLVLNILLELICWYASVKVK